MKRSECTCSCHNNPEIVHHVPCCEPDMKTFPHFNQSHGAVCPMCKTNEDCETVLVPIPGTEKGNIMEAKQVHKKCYDLAVKKLNEMTEIAQETGQYDPD